VEQAGDKLGIVGRQARSDLERFKSLIEDAGYESGAWRGTVQHGVSVGTPGVEEAALSRGDSGKAGVSATTVVAGAAAVAAAAGAAVAAAKSGSGNEQPQQTEAVPPQPATTQPVTVVDQPPPDEVRDGVLIEEHEAGGYTAPSSTEGVESTPRRDGDDPMIGGGSR
jgi:hypothetical protein